MSGATTIYETIDAAAPGSAATNPSGLDTDGGFSWSCTNPSTSSPEKTHENDPQCTGTMDFTFNGALTNPTLYFIDWPDTIGITNIDWGVPEPGSLALLGSGLLGFGLIRRRRRRT